MKKKNKDRLEKLSDSNVTEKNFTMWLDGFHGLYEEDRKDGEYKVSPLVVMKEYEMTEKIVKLTIHPDVVFAYRLREE